MGEAGSGRGTLLNIITALFLDAKNYQEYWEALVTEIRLGKLAGQTPLVNKEGILQIIDKVRSKFLLLRM